MKKPERAPAYERIIPTLGKKSANKSGKNEMKKLIRKDIVLVTSTFLKNSLSIISLRKKESRGYVEKISMKIANLSTKAAISL